MSSEEERRRWRERALFVTHLGLTEDDAVPFEAVEDLAAAVLMLLDEVVDAENSSISKESWQL
ncbi:hypothetical protein GCM10009623_34350 [Nocardioides aestuarii]|uniref:Uncharacterized protein n=1 Tax=Nocardioides aestuarii TaxID=252231 RepID=A0ABW4TSQ9_9ACTN